MTAPDDVRARFEAWWANATAPERWDKDFAWQGYCAAHADLAGEVRELVEEVREIADDLREWGSTDAQLATRSKRLDAALAKFHPTHQEKP